jgi:hypothetical protein
MTRLSLPTEEEMRRRAFEAALYHTLREWMRARNIVPDHDQFAEMVGVILNMRALFHGEASDKVQNIEKMLQQQKLDLLAISSPAPILLCTDCPHAKDLSSATSEKDSV